MLLHKSPFSHLHCLLKIIPHPNIRVLSLIHTSIGSMTTPHHLFLSHQSPSKLQADFRHIVTLLHSSLISPIEDFITAVAAAPPPPYY